MGANSFRDAGSTAAGRLGDALAHASTRLGEALPDAARQLGEGLVAPASRVCEAWEGCASRCTSCAAVAGLLVVLAVGVALIGVPRGLPGAVVGTWMELDSESGQTLGGRLLSAVLSLLIIACSVDGALQTRRRRAREEDAARPHAEAARRKRAFRGLWELVQSAAWYTANDLAQRWHDRENDEERLDQTHQLVKHDLRGHEELQRFVEEVKGMALNYGWHCNNKLHGKKDHALRDKRRFNAHRDRAMMLLHDDVIFRQMEVMINEACWACAHYRRWSGWYSDRKAVAAKNAFVDLLEDAQIRQQWPLY